MKQHTTSVLRLSTDAAKKGSNYSNSAHSFFPCAAALSCILMTSRNRVTESSSQSNDIDIDIATHQSNTSRNATSIRPTRTRNEISQAPDKQQQEPETRLIIIPRGVRPSNWRNHSNRTGNMLLLGDDHEALLLPDEEVSCTQNTHREMRGRSWDARHESDPRRRQSDQFGQNRDESNRRKSNSRGQPHHGRADGPTALVVFEEEQRKMSQRQDSYSTNLSDPSLTLPVSLPTRSYTTVDQRSYQDRVIRVTNLNWTIQHSTAGPRQGFYTGSVRNGNVPHGFGRLRFSSCHVVYEGRFRDGAMDGRNGVIYMPSGATIYRGDFFLNNKQGRGEEVFASGRRYIGQYDTDLPHGFGILYNPDGSVVHLGQWCKGKAVIRSVERANKEIHYLDQDREDLLESSFEKKPSLCFPRFLSVRSSAARKKTSTPLLISVNVPSLRSVDELEPSRSSLGSSVDGQVSFYDARNSMIAPKRTNSNGANIPIASDICDGGDILELSRSSTDTSVSILDRQP